MKQLTFFFLLFSVLTNAQDLKLKKATIQTVNHGISPTSTTTYTIIVEKQKKFRWSIDSLVGVNSLQTVKYNIVKVDNPDATSPKYTPVSAYNKCDKGLYMITFTITKNREGGRPGSPQQQKADTTNIEGGVFIYYTVNGKVKKIKVDEFEKLDTINAP